MVSFDTGEPADDADEEADKPEESATEEIPTESEPLLADEPSEFDSSDEPEPVRERDPTETGPAFPYSDVRQNPLYARDETWTEFEDKLDMELTPDLREEGIRDDELREIHDIVLEVAIDHLDEFPERLKEKRRQQ